MATEKAALVELVTNVKATLSKRGDESESDESISYPSNRGRKLKRKARFVREGLLDAPTGPKIYKEEVEYQGAWRYIIHRNKRRRRDGDDDYDSNDVEEEEAELDDNPLRGVEIDKLLAPLNSPADLPSHPTLSLPYTSRILDQLCQQALDIIVPEYEHTNIIRSLLTTFLGDDVFANLEKLESPEMPEVIKTAQGTTREQNIPNGAVEGRHLNGPTPTQAQDPNKPLPMDDSVMSDGNEADGNPATVPSDRMTTRSHNNQLTQTPLAGSILSDDDSGAKLDIDSFFFPPGSSVDRDFGIPSHEAEETRRLLLAACQRQEEFIRGLNKVHAGLLQARRRKQDVWRWCRAMEGVREHHALKAGRDPNEITEQDLRQGLSDGEDWYDREEWGLDQELTKGKEEEEEEEKTKKTRGRRTGN